MSPQTRKEGARNSIEIMNSPGLRLAGTSNRRQVVQDGLAIQLPLSPLYQWIACWSGNTRRVASDQVRQSNVSNIDAATSSRVGKLNVTWSVTDRLCWCRCGYRRGSCLLCRSTHLSLFDSVPCSKLIPSFCVKPSLRKINITGYKNFPTVGPIARTLHTTAFFRYWYMVWWKILNETSTFYSSAHLQQLTLVHRTSEKRPKNLKGNNKKYKISWGKI